MKPYLPIDTRHALLLLRQNVEHIGEDEIAEWHKDAVDSAEQNAKWHHNAIISGRKGELNRCSDENE